MDRESESHLEAALLGILEQERDALRRADIETVLALADRKREAARDLCQPARNTRLRWLASANHDLLAHLLRCLRATLITAVTPDGTLYGPPDGDSAEPSPVDRSRG